MNLYFFGTNNCIYNSRISFSSKDSEKGKVIAEILQNKYPQEWLNILENKDVILNDTIIKDIITIADKELMELLPKLTEPKGNHEIEFRGLKYRISKLSDFFRKAYQLNSLYSLLNFALENKVNLFLININILEDEDHRYTFDIISKLNGQINNDNLNYNINHYLKKNKIEYSFKINPNDCIINLIKQDFLFISKNNNIDYYKLTKKGIIIKSKPNLNE